MKVLKNIKYRGRKQLAAALGHEFKYEKNIQEAEIVSFDVFDTLIFRTVDKPTDVFQMLAPHDHMFFDRRVRAEAEARRESRREDITLDEIYDRLKVYYSDDETEELKQKEIEKELEVTYANPAGLHFVRFLQKKGKRIIITSDMYLPEQVMAQMLYKAGYRKIEKIFVSGELGKSKRSGSLFPHVAREMGTEQITHIGDHIISDYKMPRKYGWRAVLYSANENKKNRIRVVARTQAEIERDCLEWARRIGRKYQPELIVFIAKSGFLFAKPLAEYFDCDMTDISISRPGNDGKDIIHKWIPHLPQSLLFALLKSKAAYRYQEKNSERKVEGGERFQKIDWGKYHRILIVDDSTDTGYSLLAARDEVQKAAPQSEIRTLSYCVIDISKERVDVDYCRYRNVVMVSATSRYSEEHGAFLAALKKWENSYAT